MAAVGEWHNRNAVSLDDPCHAVPDGYDVAGELVTEDLRVLSSV
jgi:hypothetical protein